MRCQNVAGGIDKGSCLSACDPSKDLYKCVNNTCVKNETGVVKSVCGAVCGRADPTLTQRRANSTTSIAIAHTFTAIPGRLTSGCGHAGSPLPYGCDVAPRQNVTLASAESICGALDDCVGFSFQSPTATPAS